MRICCPSHRLPLSPDQVRRILATFAALRIFPERKKPSAEERDHALAAPGELPELLLREGEVCQEGSQACRIFVPRVHIVVWALCGCLFSPVLLTATV
jgi:hypothetical protein